MVNNVPDRFNSFKKVSHEGHEDGHEEHEEYYLPQRTPRARSRLWTSAIRCHKNNYL
jgi:hypothetical protein